MNFKLSTVSLLCVIPAALGLALASSAQAAGTGNPTPSSAPTPVVDNALVSPATFYPLVFDGYKDTTTIGYRLNLPANVTARVYNSTGSVIRKAVLGTRNPGRQYWTWGGRKNDYTRVSPGNFRIQIEATDTADHRTQSVTETVVVSTGWRSDWVAKSKGGYYTSSTATQRSYDGAHCYVDHYYYLGETDLSCWGGASAQANYNFDIPATAYNLSWSVSGITGCCSGGTISKWGTRTDATNYRVSVKVTYWREYDVRQVNLTYSYKYRV